jgi:hypothetical protein
MLTQYGFDATEIVAWFDAFVALLEFRACPN